jgi:hypothetical protein
MKRMALLLLALASIAVSCKKNDDAGSGIFKGPEVNVHDGKAWTWIQVGKNSVPEKLAVVLDAAAMNSLPMEGGDHDHAHNNWNLALPAQAMSTAFHYVGLGWNPEGHEPEVIYGLKHFDFHFYMSPPEAIAAIPPYEVDSVRFKNVPSPDYFPAGYFNPGGGVPQMGVHWLDAASPELNGQIFTQTFIYGSYNGKVNFYEPMITLQFIKDNPSFERAIPQPAKVQKAGYYPTKLKVQTKNNLTEIMLDGFVFRTAS